MVTVEQVRNMLRNIIYTNPDKIAIKFNGVPHYYSKKLIDILFNNETIVNAGLEFIDEEMTAHLFHEIICNDLNKLQYNENVFKFIDKWFNIDKELHPEIFKYYEGIKFSFVVSNIREHHNFVSHVITNVFLCGYYQKKEVTHTIGNYIISLNRDEISIGLVNVFDVLKYHKRMDNEIIKQCIIGQIFEYVNGEKGMRDCKNREQRIDVSFMPQVAKYIPEKLIDAARDYKLLPKKEIDSDILNFVAKYLY